MWHIIPPSSVRHFYFINATQTYLDISGSSVLSPDGCRLIAHNLKTAWICIISHIKVLRGRSISCFAQGDNPSHCLLCPKVELSPTIQSKRHFNFSVLPFPWASSTLMLRYHGWRNRLSICPRGRVILRRGMIRVGKWSLLQITLHFFNSFPGSVSRETHYHNKHGR